VKTALKSTICIHPNIKREKERGEERKGKRERKKKSVAIFIGGRIVPSESFCLPIGI